MHTCLEVWYTLPQSKLPPTPHPKPAMTSHALQPPTSPPSDTSPLFGHVIDGAVLYFSQVAFEELPNLRDAAPVPLPLPDGDL